MDWGVARRAAQGVPERAGPAASIATGALAETVSSSEPGGLDRIDDGIEPVGTALLAGRILHDERPKAALKASEPGLDQLHSRPEQ